MDKDKILSGTLKKRLKNEFSYLMENFNKTNAIKFNLYCKEQPVSLLFECSDMLYREPYRGLGYITEMVKTVPVQPSVILELSADMNKYLRDNSSKMSTDHRFRFESALNEIDTVIEKNPRLMSAETTLDDAIDRENYNELVDMCANIISGKTDLTDTARVALVDIVSNLQVTKSSIMITASIIARLNDNDVLSMYLNQIVDNINKDKESLAAYLILGQVLSLLYRDELIRPKLIKVRENVRELITAIINKEHLTLTKTIESPKGYVDIDDAIDEIDEIEPSDDSIENIKIQVEDKLVESIFVAFDLLTASEDELDDSYAEDIYDLAITESGKYSQTYGDFLNKRINILSKEISALESKLESVLELEWTKDGRPDPVIARHAGEVQDRVKNNQKLASTSTAYDKYHPKKDKDDDDDDEDDEDERSILSMIDDDDDDLKSEASTEGTSSSRLKSKLDTIQKNKEEAKKLKELKPKKSFTVKTMDIEKKTRTAMGAAQNAGSKVHGAARAVVSIPSAVTDMLKSSINKWDDLDDAKRKEYILKPGFRKTYFRALKLAITHAAVFAINPLLNIVLYISTKLSEQKNIRITNEIISELNTEIAVCEDKMEEAGARGDLEAKNRLRRIKDKLHAELTRVQSNSKYI